MKNTGKIIRSKKNKESHYTCISNEILQSKVLSTDEKSVLVHLLSLPETWIINKTTIWKLMNIGRERFNKAWTGLERKGHIVSKKLRGEKNLIVGYNHIVYEAPAKLSSDSPESGESENQSPQEPGRKESNEPKCNNSECNNLEKIKKTSTYTGNNTGKIPELDRLRVNDPSIEDLQADYAKHSSDLFSIKKEIIKTAKFGTNVMSFLNENDLSRLERAIGHDKLEQIKPLITQYFELNSSCKQIWEKLNLAKEN